MPKKQKETKVATTTPTSDFPKTILVYIDGDMNDRIFCVEPSARPAELVGLVKEGQQVATYVLSGVGQFKNEPTISSYVEG